jgi:hypothetical protein
MDQMNKVIYVYNMIFNDLTIQRITDPSFLDFVVLAAAELPRRHPDCCCHLAELAACTSKKKHRGIDHSPKTRGFYRNGFRIE